MATRSAGNSSGRKTSSTTRKSSSTGRKSASGSRSSSKKQTPVQPEPTFTEKVKSSPILSRMMTPIIFVIVVLVIVGIDLLLTWNDYSKFFKFLGVEIFAAVIVWVLKVVFTKSKSSDDSVTGV